MTRASPPSRPLAFSVAPRAFSLGLACAFACLGAAAQGAPPTPAAKNASSPSSAAAAPPAAPAAPVGSLDAAGARLGMDFEAALKAMALAKPSWAAGIDASSAAHDCPFFGRAIAHLEYSAGLLSARIDARCLQGLPGKARLSELSLALAPTPGLSGAEIREALVARYGAPSESADLAGGGFELTWRGAPSSAPGSVRGEKLAARLDARAYDSVPSALRLRLFADDVSGSPAPAAGRPLGGAPF